MNSKSKLVIKQLKKIAEDLNRIFGGRIKAIGIRVYYDDSKREAVAFTIEEKGKDDRIQASWISGELHRQLKTLKQQMTFRENTVKEFSSLLAAPMVPVRGPKDRY